VRQRHGAGDRRGRLLVFSLVTIVGSGLVGPPHASAHDDDPWRGRDKRLHAGISAGLGAGAYALSVPLVERRSARAAIGFAAAFSLGIAKELYDLAGAGTPSGRDLAWDAAGALAGVGAAALLDFAVCRLRGDTKQTAYLSVRSLTLRW
jgi:uncharacterized protein YfiM (DUF2279 family)